MRRQYLVALYTLNKIVAAKIWFMINKITFGQFFSSKFSKCLRIN
jgi:hypothetical protein